MRSEAKPPCLVLLASPLQSYLVSEVLLAEGCASFDLVYFSTHDSPEDRTYFNRLADQAIKAHFLHVKPKLFFILDLLGFLLKTKQLRLERAYEFALFANLKTESIAKLAEARAKKFITFDDGVGNINTEGGFHRDDLPRRRKIYRRLLRVPDLEKVKSKIVRHYTPHMQFANVVEPTRLRPLEGLRRGRGQPDGQLKKTYFIGQPAYIGLPIDLEATRKFLRAYSIDYYVKHPRESAPLELGLPLLEKAGMIAEEAITMDADGRGIHLIGWPSSTMFNMDWVDRRTVLVPIGTNGFGALAKLASESGCQVHYI